MKSDPINLYSPVNTYADIDEAMKAIAHARVYQLSQWPSANAPDAGGRSVEEWILLLQAYQTKLAQVYSECDGTKPEGRARLAKYAAIQANLALWLVQAALGPVDADTAATIAYDAADPGR